MWPRLTHPSTSSPCSNRTTVAAANCRYLIGCHCHGLWRRRATKTTDSKTISKPSSVSVCPTNVSAQPRMLGSGSNRVLFTIASSLKTSKACGVRFRSSLFLQVWRTNAVLWLMGKKLIFDEFSFYTQQQGFKTQISWWTKKHLWAIPKGQSDMFFTQSKGIFIKKISQKDNILGLVGQIKSLGGPHWAHGPYVVHSCSTCM